MVSDFCMTSDGMTSDFSTLLYCKSDLHIREAMLRVLNSDLSQLVIYSMIVCHDDGLLVNHMIKRVND